jgi:hypothetical protein
MIEAEAVVEQISGYLSSSQKVWIRLGAKTEGIGLRQAGTCALLQLLGYGQTLYPVHSVGQLAEGPGVLGLLVGDTGNNPCSQPYPRRKVNYYETKGTLFIPEYDHLKRWRHTHLYSHVRC